MNPIKNVAFIITVSLFGAGTYAIAQTPERAPIVLNLPVACDMENLCSIQKYVDHDPSPERLDYQCRRLSNDGHTGTDFRVPNFPAMETGVEVIAAADGIVRATRDGMEDISVKQVAPEDIKNRELGNAVILTHPGGWETYYGHLKKGSVRVRTGDTVKAGQSLGLIGLSGQTEYPHTHFTVRYKGRNIDPFTGGIERLSALAEDVGQGTADCGNTQKSLWSPAALTAIPYKSTRILTSGFAQGPASADKARYGEYDQVEIDEDSPALVFWVDLSGALMGDRQIFTITGPPITGPPITGQDDQPYHHYTNAVEGNKISWFSFSGKKRPANGWPKGEYVGSYQLIRDGKTVAQTQKHIKID